MQCGIKPNAVSKASSNFSSEEEFGNVLEQIGVAFRLARLMVGFLFSDHSVVASVVADGLFHMHTIACGRGGKGEEQ